MDFSGTIKVVIITSHPVSFHYDSAHDPPIKKSPNGDFLMGGRFFGDGSVNGHYAAIMRSYSAWSSSRLARE